MAGVGRKVTLCNAYLCAVVTHHVSHGLRRDEVMEAEVQGQWVPLEQEQAVRTTPRRAVLTPLAGGRQPPRAGLWSTQHQASQAHLHTELSSQSLRSVHNARVSKMEMVSPSLSHNQTLISELKQLSQPQV